MVSSLFKQHLLNIDVILITTCVFKVILGIITCLVDNIHSTVLHPLQFFVHLKTACIIITEVSFTVMPRIEETAFFVFGARHLASGFCWSAYVVYWARLSIGRIFCKTPDFIQ